ncbi:MAG: hypothetical protein R3C19_26890 [Planctomycetaceae bacterium]
MQPATEELVIKEFARPPPLKHVTEGSFFIADDRSIQQIEDGRAVPATHGKTELRADGTLMKRRAALIDLGRCRRVLQSQNEDWPETERDDVRRSLNRTYDQFVAKYGPVNKTTFSQTRTGTSIRRMPNLVKFREDPDAMLVMSLEDYDEVTGTAKKAAILRQDVVGRKPAITEVSSAEEGLLVSLDHRGCVDLPYIAELYGPLSGTDYFRTRRPGVSEPANERMGNRRRLSLRQCAEQTRRGRTGRRGLYPQCRTAARRPAAGCPAG